MAWTERGVWAGPRNPDLDLILDGLGRGSGRDTDRFRTSSGTRDRKVYDRRVALVKDLADRLLFGPLRAVVDKQVTIADLEKAYREGADALSALATKASTHGLSAMTGRYLATLSDATRDNADTHLERLVAHLGEHATTADLTVPAINQFLSGLIKDGRGKGRPAAAGTKNRYRASIQGFCSWLVREGHERTTPFAVRGAITLHQEPSGATKRLPELEPDELNAYLAAVLRLGGPEYRLLAWAHVATGADAGELHEALTVRHCRFTDGGITRLRFIRTKTEGRGAVERLVPVAEGFAKELRQHIEANELERDALVFGMCDYWKAYEIHVKAMEAAGRPGINRKDLRHVAAIRWRRAGADLEQIREWLGHTNINQTRIYAAFKPNDDFDAPVLKRLHAPALLRLEA